MAGGSTRTRTSCPDPWRRPASRPERRSAPPERPAAARRRWRSRPSARPDTTPPPARQRLLPAEQHRDRRGRAAGRGIARRLAIVDWDVHHGDGTQAIFEGDGDLSTRRRTSTRSIPGTGRRRHRWRRARGTTPAARRGRRRSVRRRVAGRAPPGDRGVRARGDPRLGRLRRPRGRPARRAGGDRIGLRGRARRWRDRRSARASRVALTLEGGYDLEALRESTAATVRGLSAGRGGVTAAILGRDRA